MPGESTLDVQLCMVCGLPDAQSEGVPCLLAQVRVWQAGRQGSLRHGRAQMRCLHKRIQRLVRSVCQLSGVEDPLRVASQPVRICSN